MKKTFRPSARLISTIGEDIIKDMHAAVVELVKNAYDADATKVTITFKNTDDKKLILLVEDNGHGMTENVIVNKWLVPSTSDKFIRKVSPKGRIMQGRKGIGRFAAAILGEKLYLKTMSENKKTEIEINWNDFSGNKYLDEVLVDVKTFNENGDSGTFFCIEGSAERREQWNDDEIEYLIKELRKLLTPINGSESDNAGVFKIKIIFDNFTSKKYQNEIIEIEPLPLLDYYDYRISGDIRPDGTNSLIYQNKNAGVEEKVSDFIYTLDEKTKFTGKIYVDFRIFDRDPEAIENLVFELERAGEDRLGKNEAKKLLNDISGVSIFRNRFRIRPYGDVGNDWLSLDKKRVQSPTQKIGANQISGIIEIQDEDISNLVEKSARDGLKEDLYYDGLISVIDQLLNYTELKRYSFRKKTGKGRKKHLFSNQLEILTDFSAIKTKVLAVMQSESVSIKRIEEVNKFIDADIDEKIKIAEELEQQIAMYQGQATLGKIMDVVMHEVRKPLSWIKNQTNNINKAYKRYSKDQNSQDLDKMMRLIGETPEQLNIITALFNRLNSLATRKRTAMKLFSLRDIIQIAVEIFAEEIKRNNIDLRINIENDFSFNGWKEDILAAIANILENAVYWVQHAKDEKKIEINLCELDNFIEISIWNNGPEIIKDLLDNNALFDPGVSGKVTSVGAGTGLGLSIAGEAIDRNGGELKVINVPQGAKFVLKLQKIEEE